ncbi:MAG: hypothetical protein JO323_00130 [Acidobacteriia bacterium]|nr:hypothetical protein [Terriglobia bacterium]
MLLSEIDSVFFETSYYMAPDKGGEKAYALLFKALLETGHWLSPGLACTVASTL